MFRVMLYAQWKWSRLVVTLGTIAAFILPALSVQGASRDSGSPLKAAEILSLVQSWGVLYPVLAARARTAGSDRHLGAGPSRSSRPRAVAPPAPLALRPAPLRRGRGAARGAGRGIAGGRGARHAPRRDSPGLEGYPVALTIRFALAVLVAYAVFFAISAGTTRTAGAILAVIGGLILVQVLASAADVHLDLLTPLQGVLLNWPGPWRSSPDAGC